MPLILPSSFDSKEEPNSSDKFHWFVEIQLQRSYRISPGSIAPALLARIVDHHEPIEWPLSAPSFTEWDPFNFSLSPITQNQEGDLPVVQLSVDNVGRTLMLPLHEGQGLEGNYVHLDLVPRSGLSVAYPNEEYRKFEFQIASASADDEVVTFKLERANFFTRMAPQDRYSARRCRWAFGSDECGYVVNDVAGFTTCGKTMADCIARGEDHEARGLPVLHPQRIGAFPGIPKQR
jgi:phage-related protein